jgi:hypothetical protein
LEAKAIRARLSDSVGASPVHASEPLHHALPADEVRDHVVRIDIDTHLTRCSGDQERGLVWRAISADEAELSQTGRDPLTLPNPPRADEQLRWMYIRLGPARPPVTFRHFLDCISDPLGARPAAAVLPVPAVAENDDAGRLAGSRCQFPGHLRDLLVLLCFAKGHEAQALGRAESLGYCLVARIPFIETKRRTPLQALARVPLCCRQWEHREAGQAPAIRLGLRPE